MQTLSSSTPADHPVTLAAAGVLGYVLETLGHEALGHGSVCMLLGGHVNVIAPLWMRCSIESKWMVAAGPAFNVLAAVLLAGALTRSTRLTPLSYFLWLCCAFNALVACGYLMVGGATTFGDWGVLFAWLEPSWVWRAPAIALGLGGYLVSLRMLAMLYGRLAGRRGFDAPLLRHRTLIPAVAATTLACLAELVAGTRHLGGYVLPVACTLLPGWTMLSMPQAAASPASADRDAALPFSWPLALAALLLGVVFVVVIGGAAGRAIHG